MKRIKPYVKKSYENNECEWKVTEDFENGYPKIFILEE